MKYILTLLLLMACTSTNPRQPRLETIDEYLNRRVKIKYKQGLINYGLGIYNGCYMGHQKSTYTKPSKDKGLERFCRDLTKRSIMWEIKTQSTIRTDKPKQPRTI